MKMNFVISILVLTLVALISLSASASLVPLTNSTMSLDPGTIPGIEAPNMTAATPTPAPTPTPSPVQTVDPQTYQPETYEIPFELDSLTGFPVNTPAFEQFDQLNSGAFDDSILNGIVPVNINGYQYMPFNDVAYNDVSSTFDATGIEDMIDQLMSGI